MKDEAPPTSLVEPDSRVLDVTWSSGVVHLRRNRSSRKPQAANRSSAYAIRHGDASGLAHPAVEVVVRQEKLPLIVDNRHYRRNRLRRSLTLAPG